METEPFYVEMPPEILNDERLLLLDRVIISLMIGFAKQNKPCFASNGYLAKKFNCCPATISNSIGKLKKFGYITKNIPDPEHGGRTYLRIVREDLICTLKNKNLATSIQKNTRQPSKKSIHNTKDNTNINKNIEQDNTDVLSINDEKELVEKTLVVPYRNKWAIYKECKSHYSEEFDIEWDKTNVVDLISLCNKMNQTYLTKFKRVSSERRFSVITGVFYLLITCKPPFMTDCSPYSFLKLFRKVIMHEKFLTDMSLNDFFS